MATKGVKHDRKNMTGEAIRNLGLGLRKPAPPTAGKAIRTLCLSLHMSSATAPRKISGDRGGQA